MNEWCITSISVCMLLIAAGTVAEEAPSGVPVYYYGWVLVNGTLAADGTTITAESGGSNVGTATVPSGYTSGSGYYHIYVNSSYSGQTVTFKVRGAIATSLTLPERGRAGLLNLSVTIADAPTSAGASSGGSGTAASTSLVGPVDAGTVKTMNFSSGSIVLSISFKAMERTSSGSIAVASLAKPEQTPAPDGMIYGYLNITSDGVKAGDIKIRFSVEKAWITQNNIDGNSVRLMRYASGWERLETRLMDTEEYVYEASSPGFSIFAVAGDQLSCPSGETECTGATLKTCRDGSWEASECANGCGPSGACNPTCAEGQKRCSSGAAETCSNGTWARQECSSGCADGTCSASWNWIYVAAAVIAVMGGAFALKKLT